MKRITTLSILLGVYFLSVAPMNSQSTVAKSPVEVMKEMKAANKALIEKQEKALLALDEMEKTAKQIRTLSKRN